MITWHADAALTALLRRYYAGEAALWPEIRAAVVVALREQGKDAEAYHIRFRLLADGYEVIAEPAQE